MLTRKFCPAGRGSGGRRPRRRGGGEGSRNSLRLSPTGRIFSFSPTPGGLAGALGPSGRARYGGLDRRSVRRAERRRRLGVGERGTRPPDGGGPAARRDATATEKICGPAVPGWGEAAHRDDERRRAGLEIVGVEELAGKQLHAREAGLRGGLLPLADGQAPQQAHHLVALLFRGSLKVVCSPAARTQIKRVCGITASIIRSNKTMQTYCGLLVPY